MVLEIHIDGNIDTVDVGRILPLDLQVFDIDLQVSQNVIINL